MTQTQGWVEVYADDYLDVREPAWGTLERLGSIRVERGRPTVVQVARELVEILAVIEAARPDRYQGLTAAWRQAA